MKMMRVGLLLALLAPAMALAQGNQGAGTINKPASATAVQVGGQDASYKLQALKVDGDGALIISSSTGAANSGANAEQVQGNAAAGAADVGNPVKAGGIFTATLPTLADGQRGNLQLNSTGALYVTISSGNAAASVGTISGTNLTGTTNSLSTRSASYLWNGTSWSPVAGDASSAFMKAPPLAKTASAVTAGSTSSQQLFAANATRSRLIIQNQDASINVFVNLGAAATAGAGSVRVAPGATLEMVGTNEAVNLIAASGTPAITAWQF